ncbi:MAG: YdcF family protein [Cyclobacteriaceae bacterium]
MFQEKQPIVDSEGLALARILWEYHQVKHPLEKSDCILVLGSHDTRVAERGAQLWLDGLAPYLIFSGGLGNFTKGLWDEPEADKFAKIARDLGVENKAIFVENRSTNTGENIQFTQQLLEKNGMDPTSFIVVQKPYMERRSYATFKKHWPYKKLKVTSPKIPLEAYPNDEISMAIIIQSMVGDLQRIKEYPKKGFQISQPIPDEVWKAFEKLVKLGFDQHLIK